MSENDLYPRVTCVPHILGDDFDVPLLNDQADRVVLSPAASRHWPEQFAEITCEAYAYLHLTGIITDIPESETDSHRRRMMDRCDAAGILSEVIYGNNQHVDLDRGEEYAKIYIDELEREQADSEFEQPFTGLFMDNGYSSYAWLTKNADDTPEEARARAHRDNDRWDMFKREVLIRLKRAFGLPIIVNNCAFPVAHHMAGRMIEGVPWRFDWQETILSIMAERFAAQGSREVILHETDSNYRQQVLALCLLLGCTYSTGPETGGMTRFIPSGTDRAWEAISDLQIYYMGDRWHYDRLFRHVDTGRRGIACMTFDKDYKRVMHARLPWE